MVVDVAVAVVECAGCGRRNRVPAVADGVPRCGACHGPLPWLAEARDENFAEVVEEARMPVLVGFWAPWSGPCRAVCPALEQIAGELAGRIKLVSVNVDEAVGTARRFCIASIPMQLMTRDGKVIAEQSGVTPAYVLRKWIERALSQP
ncbi:thiol reductase thioredoxin [Acrocarpospora phusangensis]|uniref:Thiol reductase thioredoxin n=1 Tax=Acrocarpospora phusangensis TaxID=1070424 RepID=A0A919Q7H4_9ACTN|nr:thioredoxin domain-containing protein [Acrocarpospora phusangensis]GIH23864.1 thiol reductase thioredoxin [Acrocarpospora phusangensis]